MSVKQEIRKVFNKVYGLSLQVDALNYLVGIIREYNIERNELTSTLDLIAKAYLKQEVEQPVVTKAILETVIDLFLRNSNGNAAQYRDTEVRNEMDADQEVDTVDADEDPEDFRLSGHLHVIDAFDMPRWKYEVDQKTFTRLRHDPALLGAAASKATALRDRYDIIKQRILRNEHFRPSSLGMDTSDRYLTLTTVSSLRGCKNQKFILYGMLTQLEEGKYFLEDKTNHVEVDLSEAVCTAGMFTESCFVIAEGVYTDRKIFKVFNMGMPPPEKREESEVAFGHIDFLGGPIDTADLNRLKYIEQKYENASIVVLSDVFLDQPKTMTALKVLFDGYDSEDLPSPLAFVLIGNFVSKQYLLNGKDMVKYKDAWNNLADLLATYPKLLEDSQFIFIPGPNDPWGAKVLPRPPIPDFFVSKVKAKVRGAVFASNPCRIKYCTQEIVVFREDIVNKLYRNCIKTPSEEQEVFHHAARTVVDQGHLCPLPIHVRPTYWEYEHTMRLYPIPDVVVLADKYSKYSLDYEGSHIINPGAFSLAGFQFLVYYPAAKMSEVSMIPPNML